MASIVHVVESLERGGLERVVVDLAKEQERSGHTVAVVCLFRLGEFGEELRQHAIPVFCCDKQHGIDTRALRNIRQIVKSQRAEILHSHNPVAHYYSAIATIFCRVRLRLCTRHGMGASRRWTARELFYRFVRPLTDVHVAVSAESAQKFVANGTFPRRKTRVVVNGIPARTIGHIAKSCRVAARRGLGIAPNRVLIGNVGRLNWAKDQKRLLHALAELKQNGVSFDAVIVGDGKLRKELAQEIDKLEIAGQVRLLGERSDVFELLGALDVFVLSSVTEGYSIALLEASAAGLPIVATDAGGNAEIVRHEDSGIIVPVGDTRAMSDALLALCNDSARRKAYGEAGQRWVNENGSLESMTAAYDACYGLEPRK